LGDVKEVVVEYKHCAESQEEVDYESSECELDDDDGDQNGGGAHGSVLKGARSRLLAHFVCNLEYIVAGDVVPAAVRLNGIGRHDVHHNHLEV